MDGNMRVLVLGGIMGLENGVVQGSVIGDFPILLIGLPKVTLQSSFRFNLFSGQRRIKVILIYAREGGKSLLSKKS